MPTASGKTQHTAGDGCDMATLQRDAQAADDAFHADLVRQFGAKRAGDMRYAPSSYDDMTAESAHKFKIAINRLHAVWDAQRERETKEIYAAATGEAP